MSKDTVRERQGDFQCNSGSYEEFHTFAHGYNQQNSNNFSHNTHHNKKIKELSCP